MLIESAQEPTEAGAADTHAPLYFLQHRIILTASCVAAAGLLGAAWFELEAAYTALRTGFDSAEAREGVVWARVYITLLAIALFAAISLCYTTVLRGARAREERERELEDLRIMVDSSPDGVAVLDDSDRLIAWNHHLARGLRTLGIQPDAGMRGSELT